MTQLGAIVIALAATLAACGSKQQPAVENSGSGDTAGPGPQDTRNEIEKRRDAACESLGPRITKCAVDDARIALAAGQIKQAQYDEITRKDVQAKNTDEFVDSCKQPKTPYSSRQVRVLEVCPKEESECEPLMSCLDNLNKQ
jgi:hypothetical protein